MGDGTGFEVRDNALNRLASDLQSVGDKVDGAMKHLDHSGDLGTDDLNSASHDFKSAWDYGVKQLKKKVDDLKEGVSKTAQQYDAADHHVTNAMARYSAR